MRRLALVVLWLGAASCSTNLPEGIFECGHADDCPETWLCAPGDDRCYSSVEAAPPGAFDTGGDGDGPKPLGGGDDGRARLERG